MAMNDAKRYARRARKLAPQTMYDFARSFEKAIEEMASEIETLKKALGKSGSTVNTAGAPGRPSSWS